MAKNKKNTTEKTFNAVAKQYIKYGGKHIKTGEKFKVNESDVKELGKYSEIEVIEEDKFNQEDNKGNEENEEGENGGE
ncbi:hypothetical protein [Clostridium oceanicum]|uniref:DUF7210 domain-containing protein n=1 Tax=Clostridium oceanicum TaxID=1543 RepID=A0ABP3UJR6_9CLOT